MLYLLWVFRDKLSWAVFVVTFALTLYGFKIFPSAEGETTPIHAFLGIVYAILLSLVVTCLFKTIKEKLKHLFEERKPLSFLGETNRNLRRGEHLKAFKTFLEGFLKFLVLFFGVLGLGAAQFCVFGSPVCSFSVGAAIVTALFPSFMVQILFEYAQWIILGAIVIQAVGLYFMGCFKRVAVIENN